jgi:hypothetical protein
MVVLKAHFDGKVIVPDEPVSFAPNQQLRVIAEPVDAPPAAPTNPKPPTDWAARIGIAAVPGQKPHDPGADEDALWEKGYLPGSSGYEANKDK